MLATMAELPDQPQSEYERFATRWFAQVLAVFLRSVRIPSLAYDLATETLAAARLQWDLAPEGEDAVGWLLGIGAGVLDAAVERGGVPCTERRRRRVFAPHRLTAAEQQQITALAEAHIELPASARGPADALARMAPPIHVLRQLRLSGLVDAEPLPNREHARDGT